MFSNGKIAVNRGLKIKFSDYFVLAKTFSRLQLFLSINDIMHAQNTIPQPFC